MIRNCVYMCVVYVLSLALMPWLFLSAPRPAIARTTLWQTCGVPDHQMRRVHLNTTSWFGRSAVLAGYYLPARTTPLPRPPGVLCSHGISPAECWMDANAWHYTAQNVKFRPENKGAVVIGVHGHASHTFMRGGVLAKMACPAHAAGYNVLMLELRNHGQSAYIPPVSLGITEAGDIETAIRWAEDKHHDVFLWGESMGAAAIMEAMRLAPHTSVRGMILESPYVFLEDAVLTGAYAQLLDAVRMVVPKFRGQHPLWAGFWDTWMALFRLMLRGFIRHPGFDTLLRETPTHTMVALGTRDSLLPHGVHGEVILGAVRNNSAVFTFVYEGEHTLAFTDHRWSRSAIDFLDLAPRSSLALHAKAVRS